MAKATRQAVGPEKSSALPVQSELLLKLEMSSNPEALCLVRATVERATELLHFREQDRRAIVRSVDEALANVIRHAYQSKRGLPIEVTCRRLQYSTDHPEIVGIEIILEDAGPEVDPAKLKGRELDDLRPGGLGLHFMRECMDEVEFSRKNDKNQLRLVKYLGPADVVQKPGGE